MKKFTLLLVIILISVWSGANAMDDSTIYFKCQNIQNSSDSQHASICAAFESEFLQYKSENAVVLFANEDDTGQYKTVLTLEWSRINETAISGRLLLSRDGEIVFQGPLVETVSIDAPLSQQSFSQFANALLRVSEIPF